MEKPKSMDEYIANFPVESQVILQEIREVIKSIVPQAKETISYAIPTFKLNGNLVHFAAYKNHIGFYPGAAGIDAFRNEISSYKSSRGAIQFPIHQPMPIALIKKMVEFRVNQNLEKKKG
ncbi:iron chaperone [Pedobacter sp. ASV28]|uniref:iron chaperone n=1 Tax=Pedobacter sp. ASV28 TaxID=2795123 RepID=UPI0018EA8C40|nr:DUF1801 domain-containing protein [Pedobacter sp. ASV28]